MTSPPLKWMQKEWNGSRRLIWITIRITWHVLERRLGELHPRVYIRGQVGIPKDQKGNIPVEFGKELYEVNDLALLDYGADCYIIYADFIRVELNERTAVFFDFEYIFLFFFVAKNSRIPGIEGIKIQTIAKVVPRSTLPNQGEGINILIGRKVASSWFII